MTETPIRAIIKPAEEYPLQKDRVSRTSACAWLLAEIVHKRTRILVRTCSKRGFFQRRTKCTRCQLIAHPGSLMSRMLLTNPHVFHSVVVAAVAAAGAGAGAGAATIVMLQLISGSTSTFLHDRRQWKQSPVHRDLLPIPHMASEEGASLTST